MFIIENLEEFKLMMRGGLGQFDQYMLHSILKHQNELGINTIMIQKNAYGDFICKVDEITIHDYQQRKRECLK